MDKNEGFIFIVDSNVGWLTKRFFCFCSLTWESAKELFIE